MCPVEHVGGISCQGRHHQGHEVRILIIIMIISDTMGPLPKGISHIVRMTLLTSEFRNLDLTRKSILFLLPPSGGASFIRVTATPVTLTSSAPTPPVKGLVRDGGINGHPIFIRGVMVIWGGLSNRQTPSTASRRTPSP